MTVAVARGSAVLRGLTRAHAFVLDTPLVGGAEAARRVFGLWRPGADLRLLPDGRWLLLLPEPVELRAELGPGLALGEHAGGAVTVPGPAGDISVSWRELPTMALTPWLPAAGKPVRRLEVLDSAAPTPREPQEHAVVRAPDLRKAARVGSSSDRAKRLHRELDGKAAWSGVRHPGPKLAVIGTLATIAALALLFYAMQHGGSPWADPPREPTPSVVSAAAPPVPPPSDTSASGTSSAGTGNPSDLGSGDLGAPDTLPPAGQVLHLDDGRRHSSGGSHWVFLPLPAFLLAGRVGYGMYRRRLAKAGAAGGAGPRPGRGRGRGRGRNRVGRQRGGLRSLLARLTLRSPGRNFVRGKHRRYLENLTEAFERRDYDRALRDAIVLSGPRRSTLSRLRIALPRPRTGALVPTAVAQGGGGSVPWGPSVYAHLQSLYTEAGTRLERAGRIDEAAFVYADLMQSPAKAVALLERAGRFREAAQLAEGRGLEPDLVVRLWWRAGDRDRAVDVAIARGAFATAVARLEPLDKAAARTLRLAWISALRAAGDHEHAVRVAWADAELRAEVLPAVLGDIEAGLAVGGARAARLLAYQSSASPEAARAGVLQLLADRDAAGRAARGEFLRTLVSVKALAPGPWDREVRTRALRCLVLDGGASLPAYEMVSVFDRLAPRADPLVVADLRRPVPAPPEPDGRVEVAMPAAPAGSGESPLMDAVGLDDGTVLVACGEAGVRILRPDGRTAAAWDVPAHRIVAADHGGCVLLAALRDDVAEFRRLDLATRRMRYWTTLRVRGIADTFDGSTLIVVDEDGIAVHAVDLAAGDRPRVVWRELDRDWTVLALERTPKTVAAWLLDRQGEPNRWRWDLPSWTLRQRASGIKPPQDRWSETLEDGRHVVTFGGEDEAGRIRLVYADPEAEEGVRYAAREIGGRTTVRDSAGRVVVVERGRVVAVVGVR